MLDDWEDVVAENLSALEAEILCAMKLEDEPRAAAVGDPPEAEDIAPRRRRPRQLTLKF